MPANCTSLNPDHRTIAYDVTEVDIIRCVVKSEGRKEVRVQAFFVLKKDSNVKGRKQKSFSISKFGLDGAWSRANRCKEFIEQLGRFPVDDNEIEAFQGKASESSGYPDKENRSNSADWSPFLHSNKTRRIVKDYNGVLVDADPRSSKWRDVTRYPHHRRVSKSGSAPVTESTKLNTRPSIGNAYFPCPPPLDSHPACLTAHHCFLNPALPSSPPCKAKLLEQLSATQFRYLLRFLEPPSLSAVERCSRHLRQQVQETEAWKLLFFNCIPHMIDLARLHSLARIQAPFPFEKASSLLFKGFFAFECATRTWVLWCDLRSENEERCVDDEEACMLTMRRCLQCLTSMVQRDTAVFEHTILKNFQLRTKSLLE